MMKLHWCLIISSILLCCGLSKSLADRSVCHWELSKGSESKQIMVEPVSPAFFMGSIAAEESEDEHHNEPLFVRSAIVNDRTHNDLWLKKEVRGHHNNAFILFETDNSPPVV